MDNSRLSRVPIALVTAIIGLTAAALGCGSAGDEKAGLEQAMREMPIEIVLNRHTDKLMSLPGVVGTAIGECRGKPCIKVLVVKKNPELATKIPSTLDGYPVEIDQTGEFRALDPR